MYLKTWKTSSLQDQLSPKGKRPHLVILTTHSALKLQGSLHGDITHSSEVAPEPQPRERQPGAMDPLDYSCEPLSDLKLLFRKTTKCDQGYSGHAEPQHQGTLVPTGKRPSYLHFQEKNDM